MKKIIFIDILIVLSVGLSCFIASDNWILSLIITLLYIVYLFAIFNIILKKYNNNVLKYHQCYNFINDYVAAISSYQSLLGAFDAIYENFNDDLKKELEGVKDVDILEKIKYLQSYFPFHVYYMFCQIIELYDHQGGDILNMSSYLIKQVRSIEEYVNACTKYRSSKIVELIILWGSCLLILIFIRFGLASFFETLKNEFIYVLFIAIFFAFLLFCLHIALNRLFKINIRGFSKYEKN